MPRERDAERSSLDADDIRDNTDFVPTGRKRTVAWLRIRRGKPPRDVRGHSGGSVESRLAIPNLTLAVAGVAVGILGTIFAYAGYDVLTTTDVEVVAFETITKEGVSYESKNPVGEISSGQISAPAVAITLRNSGQPPALLTKV